MMSKARFSVEAILGRLDDERGQTLAEYGMLLAVIVLVVIVVAVALGPEISQLYKVVSDSF